MLTFGIIGGSFDPPHYAHLVLAEHASQELHLDKVLFVPAAQPPHKSMTRTTVEHRVAMVELAIADNEKFELSRVDVDREGPHFTVDMIDILRTQNPDVDFVFIMGEDMFNSLPTWKRAESLFTGGALPIAVMRRLGEQGTLQPDKHDDVFPGLSGAVTMLRSPLLEISSTDVVNRLQQGYSARYLLPDVVLAYIDAHQLYLED